jgi:ribosomal protein L28
MQHTRRSWKPNVQQRYMESPVLGERVQVKVTTHALRCFAKAGGFDQWLLSSRHVKESLVATSLKRRIEEKLALDPSLTRPVPNVRMPKPPRAVTPSRL